MGRAYFNKQHFISDDADADGLFISYNAAARIGDVEEIVFMTLSNDMSWFGSFLNLFLLILINLIVVK